MPEAGTDQVRLVGLDDAARDMKRWADQLGGAVDTEARGFAGRVAGRVHPPVLTGALAASVGLVEIPDDGQGIGIGGGLDYSGWIEFGGSRGRPYIPQGRYLYPTAQAAEGEWYSLAEDTAENTVERFPWSRAV
jgi:hypothetical protein